MTIEPGQKNRRVFVNLLISAFLFGGLIIGIGQLIKTPERLPSPTSTNTIQAYAFANASPMLVFDTSALKGGHADRFEFGRAYEVDEQTSAHVRIRRDNGTLAYLRSTDVTTVPSPRWLATTAAYNKSEREFIRLWERADRLKDVLSGTDAIGSRWDYEEYFDSAPQFKLRLPIKGMDTGSLLKGTRQVKIVSVMLPISRSTYRAFEAAKANFDKRMNLYFLIDISASTNTFLEGTMNAFARAVNRNDALRNRVNSIVLATFGTGRREKSSLVGKVMPKDLENFVWHRPGGVQQTGIGEREPLIDGLITISRGVSADRGVRSVLIIISGADVELVTSVVAQGKPIEVENVDLRFSENAAAIFAQVTPEPSDDLRSASRKLRSVVPHVDYLEYSDVLADDVVARLLQITQVENAKIIGGDALGAVVKAAHSQQSMAFLPRQLMSASTLPTPREHERDADWYTVPLWMPVDELIWEETAR